LRQQFSFDESYVERLKAGDAETEDHFCKYFGALICLKANARLRPGQGAAEDIRQETLIRVLRAVRQGNIEHPERLGAYVSAVSNHVMHEMFRRNKNLDQLPEGSGEIPSDDATAESKLLKDERKNLVRAAIDALPAKDRDLLRVLVLEERDKDSVCQEYQVTREHLRVLLHRARTRLRTAMAR
jgi:RNA polymerase sigma-70 factor (ECF subfamily)